MKTTTMTPTRIKVDDEKFYNDDNAKAFKLNIEIYDSAITEKNMGL